MNALQLEAVKAPNTHVQIVAGPGTGKTFTLVNRIVEFLKRGVHPKRLVVMTFTRAAAREIFDRVGAAMGGRTQIMIGTFHSVAIRLLRKYGGSEFRSLRLVDEQDKMDLLKSILGSGDDCKWTPKNLAGEISRAKAFQTRVLPSAQPLFELYENRLRDMNCTDFDGLLLLLRDFLDRSEVTQDHIEAVLVDEFQDTSLVQLDISLQLSSKCQNLTVVGDPDQSIYGFRNADPRNFGRMARRVSTTVKFLEDNYRSGQRILDAASKLIAMSQNRYSGKGRKLRGQSAGSPASVQFVQSHREAWDVARSVRRLLRSGLMPSEISILTRYSLSLREFESALAANGIAVRVVGGRQTLLKAEARAIIDYLRVAANETDDLALQRIINYPSRGIGAKTVEKVIGASGSPSLSLIRADCSCGKSKFSDFVKFVDEIKRALQDVSPEASEAASQISKIIDQLQQQLFPEFNCDFIKDTLQSYADMYALEEDDRPFLDAFIANLSLGVDKNLDGNEITLSTIHSAKGLEWPVVYVVGLGENQKDPRDDEDLRLWYVALTRAKAGLVVTSSQPEELARFIPESSIKKSIGDFDYDALSLCTGRHLQQPRMMCGSQGVKNTTGPELETGFASVYDLTRSGELSLETRSMRRPSRRATRTDKVKYKSSTAVDPAGARMAHENCGSNLPVRAASLSDSSGVPAAAGARISKATTRRKTPKGVVSVKAFFTK